jgi:hypothetical protein
MEDQRLYFSLLATNLKGFSRTHDGNVSLPSVDCWESIACELVETARSMC